MNRIVYCFGTGDFFERRRSYFSKLLDNQGDQLAGFIDNQAKEKRSFYQKPVFLPDEVILRPFDVIVITSAYYREMVDQLCSLGVDTKKILSYDAFCAFCMGNEKCEYGNFGNCDGKKLLLAGINLNYDGGSLALVDAALAMADGGYRVTLLIPYIDTSLRIELSNRPIKLVVYPAMRYVSAEKLDWVRDYDFVLVNVFPNLPFAVKASKWRPVLWWIHESGSPYATIYPQIRGEFPQYDNLDCMKNIRVAAVSKIAKHYFEQYYPGKVSSILPLGMLDFSLEVPRKNSRKMIFALIGSADKGKGQDILTFALQRIPKAMKQEAEFWFIGAMPKNAISDCIRRAAEQDSSIRILGELRREELIKAYGEIDVVICASREETLSMAIIEGMMNRKICITTQNTGIAEYIKHEKNGFIVPVEDDGALAKVIQQILNQPEAYSSIRQEARKTYEKYFTLSDFAERFEKEIREFQ